jgi:TM2 domain-containing membrane protein YozV
LAELVSLVAILVIQGMAQVWVSVFGMGLAIANFWSIGVPWALFFQFCCGFGKLAFVRYGLMRTLLPHRRARGLGLIL